MLQFETRDGSSPSGKTWVFLCALPEDTAAWLKMIRDDIFRFCNCAIWYDDGKDTSLRELEDAIDQSAMAVLPVTAALLAPDSEIKRRFLPLLQVYQVSILPVLNDPHLLGAFNAQFRNIQVLDRHSTDSTAIPYEEKLQRFLDTMLLRDDLAEQVRQAFRSQLFLSYRKKDRALALALMKQIHKDPRCRSIGLWYDEFLTLGEDFDGNINRAIEDSDLFLLTLTHNMVNEDNYVIRSEYPCAHKKGKEILPVELESVDRQRVQVCFPGLPPLVQSAEAIRQLAQLADSSSETTPEQDYLLGLAFIHGFHAERQVSVGLEQLERSARRGYAPAALQLASIQILEDDPEAQKDRKLHWLKIYATLTSGEYRQKPCPETAQQYADALDRLAEAEFQQRPEVSFILYEQAIKVLEHHHCLPQSAQICSNYGLKLLDAEKNRDGLEMLMKAMHQYTEHYNADPEWGKRNADRFSYCYYNTGNAAAKAGNLELAQIGYTSAIQNFTVLARKSPEEYTLVLAQAYGNLGTVYRRQWASSGDPELCAKAEAHHAKAIELLEQAFDWEPTVYAPVLALELVSLSSVYLHKPDYKKAEALLGDAIELLEDLEEHYPGQYTDTLASALGNRAVLFLSQDKTARAREDLDTAIRIFRKTSGRHMELAKALWNMAITYTKEEELDQARKYFEEAIAIYESGVVQGAERNPDFAQCCLNFAGILSNGGSYGEALTWANRATVLYRGLQGGSGDAYKAQLEDLRNFTEWLLQMI